MKKENNTFDNVFYRLLELGISSQKELAGILGVTRGAISGARQRGVFPKKWAVIISQTCNRSVEWVLGLNGYTEVGGRDNTIFLMEELEAWKKEQELRWEKVENTLLFLEKQIMRQYGAEKKEASQRETQAG